MADIEAALYNIMQADAGLTALVSTRVSPAKKPQGTAYPAITFFQVSGPRVRAMPADSGDVRARFQVDSWGDGADEADGFGSAQSVKEQVRSALQRYSATEPTSGVVIHDIFLDNELFEYEDVTELFHYIQDYLVLYRE
jgi:hypothetical protein